jgi:hypothetical protein
MKRSRKRLALLGLGCLVALMVGMLGGPAVAVPPHKHCMETPQGFVEVGPRVFKHPGLHETAFHEFHDHVHVSGVPTNIRAIFDPATPCSSLNP